MFQFSFLQVKKERDFPTELFKTEKRRRDASSSLAKALSRKLCHRIDIFRVHPTFDRATSSVSNRQDTISHFRGQKSKEKRSGDEELELRTIRLLALESVRQESRCLTRALRARSDVG